MTERERLIELIMNVPPVSQMVVGRRQGKGYMTASHIADHLLANGVIVPPCKVGDTVYIVDGTTDGIVVGTITNLEQNIYTSPRWLVTFKGNYPFFGELESKDRADLLLGKTVFLSLEDAEKASKERSEGK